MCKFTVTNFWCRNDSSSLKLEDFGVKPEFDKIIPKARKELLEVEDSTTPAAKLSCLQKSTDLLSGKGGPGNELNFTVTSEECSLRILKQTTF